MGAAKRFTLVLFSKSNFMTFSVHKLRSISVLINPYHDFNKSHVVSWLHEPSTTMEHCLVIDYWDGVGSVRRELDLWHMAREIEM